MSLSYAGRALHCGTTSWQQQQNESQFSLMECLTAIWWSEYTSQMLDAKHRQHWKSGVDKWQKTGWMQRHQGFVEVFTNNLQRFGCNYCAACVIVCKQTTSKWDEPKGVERVARQNDPGVPETPLSQAIRVAGWLERVPVRVTAG